MSGFLTLAERVRSDVHFDPFHRTAGIETAAGLDERRMRVRAMPALLEYDRGMGRLGRSPALEALAKKYHAHDPAPAVPRLLFRPKGKT